MKYIAIGSTVVAVVLVVALTVLILARRRRPETALDHKAVIRQCELLDSAAQILRDAGAPRQTIEESDVLSDRTAAARDAWLRRYGDHTRKGINA